MDAHKEKKRAQIWCWMTMDLDGQYEGINKVSSRLSVTDW